MLATCLAVQWVLGPYYLELQLLRWVPTAWTECYYASSAEEAAGSYNGFCIAITHRATHRLLCHHPATVFSGSHSLWLLAVAYSETEPQGDTFRSHGGHEFECGGRIAGDFNRSLPPVLTNKLNYTWKTKKKTKLRGMSPRANYTDRAPLVGEVSANSRG
jgi:hypothetical protein